jgi:hypothetical protein
MGIPAVFLVYAWTTRSQPGLRRRMGYFIAAAGAPFLAWFGFRFAVLALHHQWGPFLARFRWFVGWQSGLAGPAAAGTVVERAVRRCVHVERELSRALGGPALLFHGVIAVIAAFGLSLRFGRAGRTATVAAVLALSALFPICFWMWSDPFFWYRRLVPAMFCLAMAALLAAGQLIARPASRRWGFALLAFLVVPRLPVLLAWGAVPREITRERAAIEEAGAALASARRAEPGLRVWSSEKHFGHRLSFFQPEPVPFLWCTDDRAPIEPGDVLITTRLAEGTQVNWCPGLTKECGRNTFFDNGYFLFSRC